MLPVVGANSPWDVLDRSMWWGIGLAVALLVLAWATYRLRSWFGEDEDRTDANQELLTHLRQMHAEGDVSDEEFRNIKGRLTEGMAPPVPPAKD